MADDPAPRAKKSRLGKWTRRGLITAGVVTGGALIVGVAIRPGHRAPRVKELVANEGESLLNIWVKIAPDNRVVAIVPHAEMGQGVHTALAQMLADELDADWNLVDVMEAPAHDEYANYALPRGFLFGDAQIPRALVGTVDGILLKLTQAMDLQITGGSLSVRATGAHGMRVAGAAAREMLAKAASAAWDVPVRELVLAESRISHAPSGRSDTYASFAAAAGQFTPSSKPKLKHAEAFNLIGKSVPRNDIPAKVDGSATFGIDAQLPGMKVATVRSAPAFGGRVAAIDDTETMRQPAVHQVVNLGDLVAVVADGYWHANRGLAVLDVEWDNHGRDNVNQAAIFAQFERDLAQAEIESNGDVEVDRGDVDAALATAARRIEAEYRVPYLAHAPMEPLNCTVWLHDGICEVWTGTQNPLGARAAAADALGMEPDAVIVHNAYLGGAFGRRSVQDYVVQAARIAQAVGAPTKLVWSREEDIAQDRYRPAVTSRFRGALDQSGRPTVWMNLYVDKHEPAEAPRIPYAIDNQRIASVASPTHVPFGVWRAVDHSQHAFFTESFVDELANLALEDPYAFRRRLLNHAPRHRKVLDAAAEKAGWTHPLGEGRGRGIALHESFGSIVAEVAEVAISDGALRVERVVCAVDAGYAVNPDGLTAQMESGIVYGLTAALHGEISIEHGRVKQSNFHDYPMLRMDEMPVVETVIVSSGGPLGGAGEPGTPPAAPALVNAIHAATGIRVRELPVSKNNLRV